MDAVVDIEGRWKLYHGDNPEPVAIELAEGVCVWDGKDVGPYSIEGKCLLIEKADGAGAVTLKTYDICGDSMSGNLFYGSVDNPIMTEAASLYRDA